jgi:formylglycine-generating enzyme required for sulfatase activity/predicted Ser/Thr protein kinase
MSSAAHDPLLLPEQFGRYHILRRLGQGGMGAVYLAHDTRLDRDVALKVCTLPDKPSALERFRREAKAAAALSHPNLCPVYDYDVHEGVAFITMRFIDGLPLNRWVHDNPLDVRAAALLVRKLALAMQAAHDGGVIHRDLKPSNVAMDRKGEPIIVDFGLARLGDEDSHRSKDGGPVGTVTHMAPEQARGDRDAIGPATDVYALGVILYELLTGELPFMGPPAVIVAQLLSAAPSTPRKLNPDLPAALEVVCLKAIAKDPAERFASMQAFADALARVVRGMSARGEGTRPPPRTPTMLTPTTEHDMDMERTPAHPAPAPPRPRASWLPVGVSLALVATLGVVVLIGIRGRRTDRRPPPDDPPITPVEPAKPPDPDQGRERKQSPARPAPIFPPVVPPQYAAVLPRDPAPQAIAVLPDLRPPGLRDTNLVGMRFVRLPKGTFYMGGGAGKPGKRTAISADFEIAVHTVTQGQWAELMEGADRFPSKFRRGGAKARPVETVSEVDLGQFPVENVSWNMAQEFIKKLNEKERGRGYLYRLPTEAEWEYACRGGATSEADCAFHFYLDRPTNNLSAREANFDGDYPAGDAPKARGLDRPARVGSYPPNRLGLYDMHGNVWEWCQDLHAEGGSARVFRGGCWSSDGSSCQAGYRGRAAPTDRSDTLGFRLVRVPTAGE